MYTFSKRHFNSWTSLWKRLLQFDGPQMIARIVLGSISPCLRFSALPPIIHDFASQFVTCIVSGCSTNFTLKARILERLFKGAWICESRSNKMYLALYPSDIWDLSAEQLQYIEGRTLTRVQRLHRTRLGQASRTRECRFGDSNLSLLRRALQSVVTADVHWWSCTEDKRL